MEKKLILEIVRRYLDENLATMQSISDSFKDENIKMSTSKVSEALHLAISQNIVSDNIARDIANKAIANSKRHSGSDRKIRQKYEELFFIREEVKKNQKKYSQIEISQDELDELIDDMKTSKISDSETNSKREFFLSTFHSSFSDADEFDIDTSTEPEDLEEKYDNYIKGLQ